MAFQKLEFGSEHVLECLKENNIIGRGGAGIVYRGEMPNREHVAVKKLLGISKGSSHDNGLSAEIQTLDFGLAKFLHSTGTSECMSAIAGSYGYIAPVGDFGQEGMDIVQWAKIETNWRKEGVVKIIDDRLNKKVPLDEAMQVFFVAMLCVQEHGVERPTMREVVQMLAQAEQPNTFHLQ
ncbi:leucine-rich receptor-like protein kinase family protein [Actinidia rufa]|uniref:Leucine-rich receptor-like protein kinase family protein n=1 Tax=Actinidia rufa TaxID=165716 RepID=A0A7J0DXI4_9ERIC|nr:leucine-rich receptor-like protein kinase family protein [Actinidia rufa]